MAEQSFGWRQPVAALIAFAAAAGPLLVAAGWMIGGADGPLERRDPVQVPAFVAEESGTRDQARTLVLDSDSTARVGYTLVRGSGARLGDAELAAAERRERSLDKVVANLVAGSGADQADELGGFAVRYVLVHKGAPREVSRVLDATPGPEPAQPAGRQRAVAGRPAGLARRRSSPASGSGDPLPVAAGPVDIHTTIPAGSGGRVLRLADAADEGWTATLDGKPLTPHHCRRLGAGLRTPRLRRQAGRHLRRPDHPHRAGCGPRASLAVVLVVMALPGPPPRRRRRPPRGGARDPRPGHGRRGPPRPPPARPGGGRRQTEQAAERAEFPTDTPHRRSSPAAAVPQQQAYGDEWDSASLRGRRSTAATAPSSTRATPSSTRRARLRPGRTRRTRYQGGQYDPYAYGGHDQQARTARLRRPDEQPTARATTPRTTRRSSTRTPPAGERPDGSQQ